MTVKINGNSSSTAPGFAGGDGDTGLHTTNDQIQLVTNSTNAVTVDASQRVGIGTSTPGSLNSNANQLVVGSGTGNQGLTVFAGSSSDANIYFADGTTGSQQTIGYIQYRHASNQFDFGTNDTTRMTIDSSGNVGIGQPSVTQFGSAYRTVELKNTDGGAIRFMDGSSTVNSNDSIVYHNTSGLYLRANGSRDINFWTNGSERVKITSQGHTTCSDDGSFYGTASATQFHSFDQANNQWTLGIRNHHATDPFGLVIKYSNASPDGSGNHFIYCEDSSGTMRMRVASDGDVITADAGTLTSDATLKRDITDASPKLADVMNLKVRNFYWTEDYHPNKQDKKLIGFVAQELEEVFPGLVSEHKIKGGDPILDEDGNDTGEKTPEVFKKGIKEAKLIPILVKALQEAVERIETLETINASFEARISALEGGN